LAQVNHAWGGLSWLSINNGRIPWFRNRAFFEWALFGGFRTRRYFVTLPGNGQEVHLSRVITFESWRVSAVCGSTSFRGRGKPKWGHGRKAMAPDPSCRLRET
jgi:hypothetical protein